MNPPHTASKFPRYCRRKALKGGRWAYFFEPPTWARKQSCPVKAEALGVEHAAAVERAENVLLPAFDSWRSRGLTDMVPAFPIPGTFDWLVCVFKTHQKWKEIDHKTQRLYERGLALFANHTLKDGSRTGSKQTSFLWAWRCCDCCRSSCRISVKMAVWLVTTYRTRSSAAACCPCCPNGSLTAASSWFR